MVDTQFNLLVTNFIHFFKWSTLFVKRHISSVAALMSLKNAILSRIVRALSRITTAPVMFLRRSTSDILYRFSENVVKLLAVRAPRAYIIPVMLFLMLLIITLIVLLINLLF